MCRQFCCHMIWSCVPEWSYPYSWEIIWNVLSVHLWLFFKREMVRQRVTGTEWCIQMSLMICFEVPVPENCDLCCCYTFLCMVSSQASLGIVFTMSTDIWAALCAEAARAVCSVHALWVCYTPARQEPTELCVTGSHLPEPPPLLGALGRWALAQCAAGAGPGQVCVTWLNPLWLLHSPLAVPPLCSRKKIICKLLVYVWKWGVCFRGFLGRENKPVEKLLNFIIKLPGNLQEMEPQTGTSKNFTSI